MESSSAAVSVDHLRQNIARSGLLPSTLVEPIIRSSGSNIPAEIIDRLVDERLLTPFQARLLMTGRHAGFFMNEKYKLLDFIGSGGMGKVYLCEHLLLHRLVAVKLLQTEEQADEKDYLSAVERFHREARAVASLDHPNIVRVFDVDRLGRRPFMVMEYVDGTNLHHLVTRHGAFDPERTANCIAQAAAGLEHARVAGLVHRDVKPSNILLDRNGAVKLLDLGLARFADDSEKNESITARFDKNVVIGTVDFMAPEQVVDSSAVDVRSDIYSLGCTMYFLLTGRVPFPDKTAPQKMFAHQNLAPEPLSALCPLLPDGLNRVIERMIEKNPADRFQTPAEIIVALEPWANAPQKAPESAEMPPQTTAYYRMGLSRPDRTSSPLLATPSPGSNIDTRLEKRVKNWREAELPPSDELLSLSGADFKPAASVESVRFSVARSRSLRVMLVSTCLTVILASAGGVAWWRAARHARPTAEPETEAAAVATQKASEPRNMAPAPFVGTVVQAGGSTFISPLMKHWAAIYEKRNGVRVDYQDLGSGKGRQGVIDHVYRFGCTDAPLDDGQLALVQKQGGTIIHLPLVMGAVVPAYNLPNVGVQLRFTGKVLGDVYLGKITRWNDPAIQASNPGVSLPPTPITVTRRADGSGTTYIWTDYLGKVNAEWNQRMGIGTDVQWIVGVSGRGNQGIADAIGRTIGSIGYVELTYALESNLTYGLLRNREGKFVEPSLASVTAACEASLREIPADLRYSLTDAPGPDSYPIAGTVWAILYRDQRDNPYATEMIEFLRWSTHEGQAFCKDLKYAPLPPELVKRIDDKLSEIQHK